MLRAHEAGQAAFRSVLPEDIDWKPFPAFPNWEFNDSGFMMRRFASINDLPIKEAERKFFWPLGRRPVEHPGLSDLNL